MDLSERLLSVIRESRILKVVTTLAGLVATLAPAVHYLEQLHRADASAAVYTGVYITQLGEHRCESLPDQSRMCLNTNSRARYTFNGSTRHVEILQGEASFVVRNDSRPFDVLSGSLLIHDISTIFDVYKKRDSTLVTVIEGKVQIEGPVNIESRLKFDLGEASKGWQAAPTYRKTQQVEFDEINGSLREHPQLPEWRLSQLLAWEHGRIDLAGSTLGEALDEFARYQPVSHFRYPPSIGKMRVGGSIEYGNLDDLLAVLEKEFHIYHTKTGTGTDTIVTLSRHPTRK